MTKISINPSTIASSFLDQSTFNIGTIGTAQDSWMSEFYDQHGRMPTFDEIQAHIQEELGPEPTGTTGGTTTVTTGNGDGNDGGLQASNNQNGKIKSSFSNSIGFGGIAKAARGTLDFAAQAGGFEKNDTMDGIYDTASDVASQFGPWGLLAAGIIDTWNFIDKAGGKDIKGFDGQTGSSSYADFTVQDKRLRMTQSGAAGKHEAIRDSKLKQYSKAMGAVNSNRQAVQARAQAADNMNRSFLNKKSGGVSGSLLTARNGGTLRNLKSIVSKVERRLILNGCFDQPIQEEVSDIKMFKDGGAVIPSGALHKNKHHLENIDPNLKSNITSKGIPVITIEEGGEIKQHAEIEKEEVILSLSLTQQIEQLWKEGTDEAAIEAGKLLTEALLQDTEDNVGLIEKIENENKG